MLYQGEVDKDTCFPHGFGILALGRGHHVVYRGHWRRGLTHSQRGHPDAFDASCDLKLPYASSPADFVFPYLVLAHSQFRKVEVAAPSAQSVNGKVFVEISTASMMGPESIACLGPCLSTTLPIQACCDRNPFRVGAHV